MRVFGSGRRLGRLVLDRFLPGWLLNVRALLEEHGQVAVTIAALALGLLASHLRSTPYNNDTLLAGAFLNGRVWIDWPGAGTSDALLWNGHRYVIEGPAPAVLMIPLVLVAGKAANQTTLAIVLAAFAVAATWDFLQRLGTGLAARLWLTLFFFAGTTLWWCAQLGDVWFLAHCSAVAFTMLALRELAAEKPRGWVVALGAAVAFESRFTLVLALPFYAYFLWRGGIAPEASAGPAEQRIARARAFCATLVPVAAFWAWYNLARWGVWYDLGYVEFFHRDPWGQPAGSPFRLSYLPYQIFSFFLQPPVLVEWHQQAMWPIFKVDVNGVALTWSSPALALAFAARASRAYLRALWGLIALVALPSFLYYLNGWFQYGMRHALDFEPYLLVLMVLAAREGIPRWGKALIAFSCLMSVWGIWYWNAFYRTGN
ncbi:MAG: hypothetical protein JOY59_06015 [Candidatus Eremiobacteraeota bacterium]|nr:hypothetical protein [Candidatus Eremiobacteraeota bacterium]